MSDIILEFTCEAFWWIDEGKIIFDPLGQKLISSFFYNSPKTVEGRKTQK